MQLRFMLALALLSGILCWSSAGQAVTAPDALQHGLRYFRFDGAQLEHTSTEKYGPWAPVRALSPKSRPDATPLRNDVQRLRKEKVVVGLSGQWDAVAAGYQRGFHTCQATMTHWELAIETQCNRLSAATHRYQETRKKIDHLSGTVKSTYAQVQHATSSLHLPADKTNNP